MIKTFEVRLTVRVKAVIEQNRLLFCLHVSIHLKHEVSASVTTYTTPTTGLCRLGFAE